MRKNKTAINDLDTTLSDPDMTMSTRIERSIKFTKASIHEALRDYLYKHNREVPPPDARLYMDGSCFGSGEATFSWTERVENRK